jgi:hypothetical protein
MRKPNVTANLESSINATISDGDLATVVLWPEGAKGFDPQQSRIIAPRWFTLMGLRINNLLDKMSDKITKTATFIQ